MALQAAGRVIVTTLAVVAILGLSAPIALSDSHGDPIAKTVEEHQAKVKLYSAKADAYRKDAAAAREKAARYRNRRDGKMRPINTPAHRQLIEDLEEMARDADELAGDADRIAWYHERQIQEMQK